MKIKNILIDYLDLTRHWWSYVKIQYIYTKQDIYIYFNDKNKELYDRIKSGALVSYTDIVNVINELYTLPDGTLSYDTVAECYCDSLGWYTDTIINDKIMNHNVITSIEWINFVYVKYFTVDPNYMC